MQSVTVTAADFNGESFDGCPFKPDVPEWLLEAERHGRIAIKPDDRDYACWNITTPAGVIMAEPGDVISLGADGALTVRKAA